MGIDKTGRHPVTRCVDGLAGIDAGGLRITDEVDTSVGDTDVGHHGQAAGAVVHRTAGDQQVHLYALPGRRLF